MLYMHLSLQACCMSSLSHSFLFNDHNTIPGEVEGKGVFVRVTKGTRAVVKFTANVCCKFRRVFFTPRLVHLLPEPHGTPPGYVPRPAWNFRR